MNDPLLSIAIPTFNRSEQLNETLKNIMVTTKHWAKHIEIVVSDNASRDNTKEVVEKYLQQSEFAIKYFRNSKNLGVSKNLVSLYERSSGEYFLFMGDDDKLYRYGFNKLMNVLSEKKPSAVIQKEYRFPNPKKVTISFLAKHYFYKYGNAYCGVINRQAAVSAIKHYELTDELHKIVWPQTAIAFIAMQDAAIKQDLHPLILDQEIGHSPSNRKLNVLTFHYYHQTLFDLLKAANIVDSIYPELNTRGFIRRWKNGFFKSLFISMLKHALTEDLAIQLRRRMFSEFSLLIGARGKLLALSMLVFRKNIYARFALKFLLSKKDAAKLDNELTKMRLEKLQARTGKLGSGVRFGNYWDAD